MFYGIKPSVVFQNLSVLRWMIMPMYEYRREDGTTFEIRQRFTDEPLTVDPQTGQRVVRVVQPTGVIFKGSGFYVNDSKNASKASANGVSRKDDSKSESAAKGASELSSSAAD
jgi:putative FmdB family regulatory protein